MFDILRRELERIEAHFAANKVPAFPEFPGGWNLLKPAPKPAVDPWALALRYEQGWFEGDEKAFSAQLTQGYSGPANPDGTAGTPVVKSFVSWDASTPSGIAELVAKFNFDPTGRPSNVSHIFMYATFEGAPLPSAFHGIPPNNLVQG